MTELPDLRPGDPGVEVRAICDALNGKPELALDRERIVTAILASGRANGGVVDPNDVRVRLTRPQGGLDVPPRLVSAVYGALTAAGVLVFEDWVRNTDTAGRNSGKPARSYRLGGHERAAA